MDSEIQDMTSVLTEQKNGQKNDKQQFLTSPLQVHFQHSIKTVYKYANISTEQF